MNILKFSKIPMQNKNMTSQVIGKQLHSLKTAYLKTLALRTKKQYLLIAMQAQFWQHIHRELKKAIQAFLLQAITQTKFQALKLQMKLTSAKASPIKKLLQVMTYSKLMKTAVTDSQ